MNKKIEKKIQDMLYNENTEEVLAYIDKINDPETLYIYAYNFNWDDGFEIPEKIIRKECCDLSTALMIFYKADGLSYLQEKDNLNGDLPKWTAFIEELYFAIKQQKFPKSSIKFEPPLNKVQLYRLKKLLGDEKEKVFVERIGTEDLNVIL